MISTGSLLGDRPVDVDPTLRDRLLEVLDGLAGAIDERAPADRADRLIERGAVVLVREGSWFDSAVIVPALSGAAAVIASITSVIETRVPPRLKQGAPSIFARADWISALATSSPC